MNVASGTSAAAAIREASGTTRWIKPAPAALAPRPHMEGAWMNLPHPPTTVTVPTEYLLESLGRLGNAVDMNSGTCIRLDSIPQTIAKAIRRFGNPSQNRILLFRIGMGSIIAALKKAEVFTGSELGNGDVAPPVTTLRCLVTHQSRSVLVEKKNVFDIIYCQFF
jgi:hypothetical protein